MKYLVLAALFCISTTEAVNLTLNKKIKVLNEYIDFEDDEPSGEKAEVQLTYDQLAKEDHEFLQGFDQLVMSANRNADLGSMNVEMAKAQLQQLVESLKGLNINIKKEKDQIDSTKDK